MDSYSERIKEAAGRGGPLIVALDHPVRVRDPAAEAARVIESVAGAACAVKINFHLLLRLGPEEVSGLCAAARRGGMLSIADIKLNDIGSTNEAALDALWPMGFDAVIANPIMGRGALEAVARAAHGLGRGVISLCHMSAPEAREAYEAEARASPGGPREPLYRTFLAWARAAGSDGIVVGATFPGIIRECARAAPGLDVYSPGVGAQGADGAEALEAGASYVIAGRSVIGAGDPAAAARQMTR